MTGQMGMAPGAGPEQGQPGGGQSQEGSGRTAPGGTPGNAGGVGTEAAQAVSNADAQGEQQADQAAGR